MKDKIVEILKAHRGQLVVSEWGIPDHLLSTLSDRINEAITPDISEEEINAYSWWKSQQYTDYENEQEDIQGIAKDAINWALSKTRNETPPKDGVKVDELLESINKAQDHNFTNSLDAYYTGCRDGVRVALSKRVKGVSDWIRVEDQKPPEGIPIQCYHPEWIDPDFNPKGIRHGHVNSNGTFESLRWNPVHDYYVSECVFEPSHWAHLPDPPKRT